jgi:SAM-dependent methyltransferase
VGTGRDVIELGCRDGSLLDHFLAGNRVTGCDIDRAALQKCAERHGISTHVVNLNEPLPFEAGSFDVVVLSEVLEHLPYPALTLGEAARILRSNGRLVGSVPNGARLPNRLRFLVTGRVERDPTHLHHFGPRSLAAVLGKHFERVRVEAVAGRLAPLSARLLASCLLFVAEEPRRG